mmetsp:Transcript_38459/g.88773  ORF Transcript_38459/g.88773 Transcript_38459/m.88773 type:complete len:557 (-) Transcript_38459:45-1715(-)
MSYYGVSYDQMYAGLGHENKLIRIESLDLVAEFGASGAVYFGYGNAVAGLLNDADEDVSLAACRALPALGDAGKEFARKVSMWLEDVSERRVVCAVATLGYLHSTEHMQGLTNALLHSHFGVRAAACLALGEMEATVAAGDMAKCMQDKMPRVVSCAIIGLSKLAAAGREHEGTVVAMAQSPSKEIRASVAEYFVAFKDLAVKHSAVLCKLLSDSDLVVREKATEIYRALGADAAPMLPDVAAALPSAAAALALGYIGSASASVADQVVAMVEDGSREDAQKPFIAAGIEEKVANAVSIPACAAVEALMNIDSGKYAPKLLTLLDGTTSPEVKEACLRAIAIDPQSEYEDRAITLLQAPQPRVRAAAAFVLGEIATKCGPSADVTTKTAELLVDESVQVRAAAVEAIGKMGDEGSAYTEAVLELFQDRSVKTKAAAITAMSHLGAKGELYATQVAKKLNDEYILVQRAAIQALAAMGARGCAFAGEVAALVNRADVDQRVRAEAIAMLADKADAQFKSCIEDVRHDALPMVRQAAEKGLENMVAVQDRALNMPEGE